jgi:hypothetical protein
MRYHVRAIVTSEGRQRFAGWTCADDRLLPVVGMFVKKPVLLEITHCEIQREFPFLPYRSWSLVVSGCQKIKYFLLWECAVPMPFPCHAVPLPFSNSPS